VKTKMNDQFIKIFKCIVIFLVGFLLLLSTKLTTNGSIKRIYINGNKSLTNYITPNEEFSLNPKESLCHQDRAQLFIAFVILSPSHFEKRMEIRQTWGNNKLFSNDFKLIFTIGASTNLTVNQMIIDEFRDHKDILQINNFTDSYFTLTTKIMKSFKWISRYCNRSMYVLRINDDVMANTFHLINYFKKLDYKKNQIYGNLLKG
jgi:hypothetical protein